MDDAEDDGYDIDEPDDERLRGNGIGIVAVGGGSLFVGHCLLSSLSFFVVVCVTRVW